ncbi:glucan endo-1,3-beta-D-glucosidase-like isoform X1 [Ipomoea triloba]|uniref:glucan endo-1,3-beta-D-glucosidase-like isoform X1 n=1 Tax=Ipomoea triloba TaxID=35885 RepID=UPI00125E99CC|nr:glucan endo-1,3-beta-D-glucosidase-like isoform X1 [Ipomoea triloba]
MVLEALSSLPPLMSSCRMIHLLMMRLLKSLTSPINFTSMAKSSTSVSIIILFLLLHFSTSGNMMRLANAQAPGQGSWCLPRPSASYRELMDNMNYACNVVNCTAIRRGGPCFHPNSLINHASFVMNLYYQKAGRNFWNCDFKNTAVIVVTDPSYGNCKYDCTQ